MMRSTRLSALAIVAIAVVGFVAWYVYTLENPDLAKRQLHSLQQTIAVYRLDTGALPKRLDDLLAKNDVANWNGPYVKTAAELRDPRSREFRYEVLGANSFRLSEVRSDGRVLLTDVYNTQAASH